MVRTRYVEKPILVQYGRGTNKVRRALYFSSVWSWYEQSTSRGLFSFSIVVVRTRYVGRPILVEYGRGTNKVRREAYFG